MNDDGEQRMLTELGGVLGRIDPIPAEATLAARSALAWRRMDAELAELLHDSALETAGAGATRSTARLRALAFESSSGVSLEIEISEDGDRRSLIGQVVPATAAPIAIRHPGGTHSVTSDAIGRFRFDNIPGGPMSLRCEPPDGAPIETGWVVI